MSNKQLVAVACLMLSLTSAAAAAESASFAPSFSPLLFAVVGLLAALFWLGLQLRRQMQEKSELTARLHLAEQVVDQTPLPILRLDPQLKILAANQCALRAYDRSSLIGTDLLALHPELAEHPVAAALQPAKEDGASVADNIFPGQEKAEVHGELVAIDATGEAKALWFGPPPENRRLIQAASDAASLAEESASRMKSEFIANINHEVRTPMNAIIGYTEMLINSQLAPKEKRFVAIIHKSSMALVSIFNDIMELSKIDSGRLQIMASSVRLVAIVNEVEGVFKDLADEKGIHLGGRIVGHLPQFFIFDGVRLKQILQNLVGNAVKFTHEGSVMLLVDGSPSPTKQGCYNLSFAIEDTGIGIPETDQQKIIELFRQREDVITKRYGGVGLGLTLCSRLAAMMGGRIDLESTLGKGTRFTVSLDNVPVAEAEPVMPESDTGLAGQENVRKLLVVDDVDLIKDVFLDFFQGSSYQVLTANNGEEAVSLARTERPDIIFMDLNLSGTDGRSVTETLRRTPETAAIPVVVMTGEMLEEEDYRPLFDDFLQKPFRLEALKAIVGRHTRSQSEPTAQPEHDSIDEEEQLLAAQVVGIWDTELDTLRQQAIFSGSLADATEFGGAVRQRGMAENLPSLTKLGEELLLHAHEPNILGVDRLLAKLSRIATRNESHDQEKTTYLYCRRRP